LDTIQRKARDIASGIEPSNLNELIYIAPITRRESRHIHLVAVTQAGTSSRLILLMSNVYFYVLCLLLGFILTNVAFL